MKKPAGLIDYVLEVDTFGPKNYRVTIQARNDKAMRGIILGTIVDVFGISHLGHIKEVRLWKKIDPRVKLKLVDPTGKIIKKHRPKLPEWVGTKVECPSCDFSFKLSVKDKVEREFHLCDSVDYKHVPCTFCNKRIIFDDQSW